MMTLETIASSVTKSALSITKFGRCDRASAYSDAPIEVHICNEMIVLFSVKIITSINLQGTHLEY